MRITVNKDYKCIREYGTIKELDIWRVYDIQGVMITMIRNNNIYSVDKRVFPTIFEVVKK